MSVIVPADHHATFAGWHPTKSNTKSRKSAWSRRRQVGFILVSALASWVLVLSPFAMLD